MDNDPEKTEQQHKDAMADARIGSTALNAALLYSACREKRAERHDTDPLRPQDAPATD